MQLKRVFAAILSALTALSLSGCSVVNTNIETVVSPPKMTSEQAAIYKALENTGQTGKNIDLKYPQSGENRSAIVLENIDDEESREALVFYESKTQSSMSGGGLRVCLLDQIGGEWVTVWDVAGAGTEVDKVVFLYDSETARKLVIIGFSIENQQQKIYKVFTYEDKSFNSIFEGNYQVLEVYDIDEDGQDEIITVNAESSETDNINKSAVSGTLPVKTKASLIEYRNETFEKIDEIELLGQAVEYNNILKDENNATFGRPALFLDEVLATKSLAVTYATEILVCENGKLKNLVDDGSEDRRLFQQTYRVQAPSCDDIDRDGRIEIPNTRLFPGYSESDEHPMYMTEWYCLTEGELTLSRASYINYTQGFGFLLPNEWIDKVTVKSVVENDEISFFVFDETLENDSRKILSLKVDNISENTNRSAGIPAGYFELSRVGQLAFLAKNHNIGGEFNIQNEEIFENFVDLYLLGD